MPNKQGKKADPEPGEIPDQQWELALAYRRRSDKSANYLRALLFASAGAAAAYVASLIDNSRADCFLVGHAGALILFGVALILLFRSWGIQKRKADERFKWLCNTENKLADFPCFDQGLVVTYGKNYILDLSAFILILIGLGIEAATKFAVIVSH